MKPWEIHAPEFSVADNVRRNLLVGPLVTGAVSAQVQLTLLASMSWHG